VTSALRGTLGDGDRGELRGNRSSPIGGGRLGQAAGGAQELVTVD